MKKSQVAELEALSRDLRERERDLQVILDHMPAMIGCWDRELRNRFSNQAYREWLGVDPEMLAGRHIRDVVGETLYRKNLPRIEAVLRGEPQVFERLIPAPDGRQIRHALTHYIPDRVGTEVRGFFVLVTDISPLKEIESKLRDSEERYRAELDAQTDAISRFRVDGVFLYVNEVYCRFFGKHPEELLGQRWHPVAHPDDLPLIEAALAKLAVSNPVVTIENRVYSGSGELRWMQFINRGFFDSEGQLYEVQSVGRDVTARKEAELALQEANERLEQRVAQRTEELHRLAVEMTLAESRERQAIARDLHDELGQLLHVAKLKLDALGQLDKREPARSLCRQLDILLTDASSRVRSLTGQLSPPVLEKLGLLSAFYWLATEMADAYALDVHVSAIGSECRRLTGVQATILFRCVRELLINVARHATTRTASLEVLETASELVVVVEDMGRGYDPALTEKLENGFGLASIRERMYYMGGSFQVDSRPGAGTRARLRLPLPREGG